MRIAVSVAVFLVGMAPVGAFESAGPPECSGVRGQTFNPAENGRWVPVILVHGIDSSASRWDLDVIDRAGDDLGESIVDRLASVLGTALYTFDYHDASLRWVDDADIGPKLQDAVVCLSDASGEQVVIVAHSMGGLAARWVARQQDEGGPGTSVGDRIGLAVTVGTPFEGSVLLTVAGDVIEGISEAAGGVWVLVARSIIAACGLAASVDVDYCPLPVVRILDSEAGRALRADSEELSRLLPWPSAMKVHPLAGSIEATVGLFYHRLGTFDLGDIAVTVESAIDGSIERSMVQCTGDVSELVTGSAKPCFHTQLPQLEEVTDAIRFQLVVYLRGVAETWELVLRSDGIGLAQFGEDLDSAVKHLTDLLGPPSEDLVLEEPPLGTRRFVSWGGIELISEFDNTRRFAGYWVDRRSTGSGIELLTERGIGVGSTVAELREAYGPEVFIVYEEALGGWQFSVGPPGGAIYGILAGDGQDDKIRFVAGGLTAVP